MPLPTITNCYQVRLNWTNPNAPRPASNVFHVTSAAGAGQEAAIMASLNARVVQSMWALVATSSVVGRVDITYLGAASATQSFIPTTPLHWTGASGTDIIPQGCAVITLQTASRGKSHRGRLFLPWVGEPDNSSGVLLAADVTTTQTNWTTFVANLITDTFPLAVASAKLNSATSVVSVLTRPYLKTQRRRARR